MPIEGYCWPLSAAPGERIEFKVSSSSAYQVTYLRLKTSGGGLGVPMTAPETFVASAQTTAPDWVSGGCNWSTTFDLTIPHGWPSGIYAAQCSDTSGDTFHIVFIVKPVWSGRKILALASTNTWSAYNSWGDCSKYGPIYVNLLTFLRPNPATTPVDDGQTNHLTRADLWILGWLEDRGYLPDVITDTDLHTGFGELNQYAALILNSHPEYWSLEMVDAVQGYLGAGGSALYLGGNGMFERCIFNADATSLTFFNGGDPDEGNNRAPAFLRNQSPPRAERAILGVGFLFSDNNWGGNRAPRSPTRTRSVWRSIRCSRGPGWRTAPPHP
jgi:hypothetical protein